MIFKKWSICKADLDPVIGSEQGKSRPVLIISEDQINALLNIVNILPITSRKPGRMIYPNEVLIPTGQYGLVNESIILCHQIRTVDKKRLSKTYGQINDSKLQNDIVEALCFQLGIGIDQGVWRRNDWIRDFKMSRSKKIFLGFAVAFFAMIAYLSYDISSRTSFPGSKSQLKERLKKQYLKEDSTSKDTLKSIHR